MALDPNLDLAVPRPPVETLVFRSEPENRYSAVLSELFSIFKDLRRSPRRSRIMVITASLIGVLIVNMAGQIYLNQWNGDFFRGIEQKNLPAIKSELWVFVQLVAVLLSVVVFQTWLHERFKIRVREWLTHHLLDKWLVHGRAYRLGISADEAVNPDQRIQEDVRNFSEMSADLGIGLIQATLLLLSFIGVLWAMSPVLHTDVGNYVITVPGYMVWVAVIYALIGSSLTARVGRPLILLNERRYAREASFRFSVVRVSESSESIAFYRGEADERKMIDHNLSLVLKLMARVSNSLARLTWITSGYGWIMLVLPVVVALPGYLDGSLDLGGMMMVVGAFGQVQASLRWFVDNFAKIADWRAALHRVVVFRDAVSHVDEYENEAEKIQLLDHPDGHLSFEQTKVSFIDGEVVISDATAHIQPGERVLITGESGSGKSTLFRAIGGLWPWGSGVIKLPPRDQIMFLPQKPYMPLGTLANSLSYPRSSNKSDRPLMEAALRRVNLHEFIPMLDEDQRWDKMMSLGQQQRLAFARLLIHKPRWVFLDEATSALDDFNQDSVMSLFTNELNESTILSIGHRPNLVDYHTRTLQLMTTQAGTVLRLRPKKRNLSRFAFWRTKNESPSLPEIKSAEEELH